MAPLGIEHGVFAAADAATIIVSTLRAEAPSTPIETIVLAAPHASEVRALSDALQAAEAGARSR
jgi:hypothetical protein